MIYATVQNGEIADSRNAETVVPWFSFGKTVIAAAALTFVRDGILELDTPVDHQFYTLRHLLQHRAGLCDYGALPEYRAAVARGDKPWPASDMLARADAQRLRYPPGRGWAYSNIGYFFARQLIERVSGKPFDVALRERVFRPLDIEGVKFAANKADLAGVDMGEAVDYDPGWVYHGLLVGPLSQAALLLDRLLDGGLLDRSLLFEMSWGYPLDAATPDRPWRAPGYGLGLMAEIPDGPVGHTGGGAGSVIAVYGSRKTPRNTVAVFASGDRTGEVERAAFELISAPTS